jgi:hypothetical protein
MSDDRETLERHELTRWVPILAAVLVGLALYFVLAPRTPIVLDIAPPAETP